MQHMHKPKPKATGLLLAGQDSYKYNYTHTGTHNHTNHTAHQLTKDGRDEACCLQARVDGLPPKEDSCARTCVCVCKRLCNNYTHYSADTLVARLLRAYTHTHTNTQTHTLE